jgi:hypothetical protein
MDSFLKDLDKNTIEKDTMIQDFIKAQEANEKLYQDEIDNLKFRLKNQRTIYVHGVLIKEVNNENIGYIKKLKIYGMCEYTKDGQLVLGREYTPEIHCQCTYNGYDDCESWKYNSGNFGCSEIYYFSRRVFRKIQKEIYKICWPDIILRIPECNKDGCPNAECNICQYFDFDEYDVALCNIGFEYELYLCIV